MNALQSEEKSATAPHLLDTDAKFSVVGTTAFKKAIETPPEDALEAVLLEEQEQIDTTVIYFCSGGWPRSGHRYKQVKDHYFNSLVN